VKKSLALTAMRRPIAHLFVLTLSFAAAENAWALCTTLIKGPVAINVKQCSATTPETTFSGGDAQYSFIKDLPPANRKQVLDSYRGSLIEGTVTNSQAIRTGISEDKGALLNESIKALIPQGASNCEAVLGKTIEVQLTQSCCDGGGATPCLLDTDYILTQVKITDLKASVKANSAKRSPEAQALYGKAKQAISVRDFKSAAGFYEQARSKGELDVNGQFSLAALYRELDKCPKAIPILEGLQKLFEKKEYWTDTENAVVKGSFLYARCLAMMGKASESVLVLQGFLVEKNRFRKEIKDSLFHRDFGGIRTSKSYLRYKVSAEKAIVSPMEN
jgi:hypothetical protein